MLFHYILYISTLIPLHLVSEFTINRITFWAKSRKPFKRQVQIEINRQVHTKKCVFPIYKGNITHEVNTTTARFILKEVNTRREKKNILVSR